MQRILVLLAIALGRIGCASGGPNLYGQPDEDLWPIISKIQRRLGSMDENDDEKHLPDMRVLLNKHELISEFGDLEKRTAELSEQETCEEYERFVKAHFEAPDLSLEFAPPAASEPPAFLQKLENPDLRELAGYLLNMWTSLSKGFLPAKKLEEAPLGDEPVLQSLIPLPRPFLVPGGRFRELYYWDSFWVQKGLLVSGMFQASEDLLENMTHLIERLGFVPNGSRWYYTNRSQPPFFTQMLVASVESVSSTESMRQGGGSQGDSKYQANPMREGNTRQPRATNKKTLFEFNYIQGVSERRLNAAIKEHEFWIRNRSVEVVHPQTKKKYLLARYNTDLPVARIESFKKDMLAASSERRVKEEQVFRDIVATTESGWDFSTRWRFKDAEGGYTNVRASRFIPVDLNSLLLKNERVLEVLLRNAGRNAEADEFAQMAQSRAEAIDTLMWNPTCGMWTDLVLEENEDSERYSVRRAEGGAYYASNLFPLLLGVVAEEAPGELVKALWGKVWTSPEKMLARASDQIVGQDASQNQWDGNNIWPPLQQLFIEYFIRIGEEDLALRSARDFVEKVLSEYRKHHNILEKYSPEGPGHGGEYMVQEGFGWTNGTLLWLMKIFGNKLAPDVHVGPIPSK